MSAKKPLGGALAVIIVLAVWCGFALSRAPFSVSAVANARDLFTIGSVTCHQNRVGDWEAGDLSLERFYSHSQRLRSLRAELRRLASSGSFVRAPRIRREINTLTLRRTSEDALCREHSDPSAQSSKVRKGKFSLFSDSFINRGELPEESTCMERGVAREGGGVSPPMEWRNVPTVATHLALLVHDPDSQLLHWFIVIDKKSSYWKKGFPLNVPSKELGPQTGVAQRANSFGLAGYTAPCPAAGEQRRYSFELYAVRRLKLGAIAPDAAQVQKALKKFQIGRATFTGFVTGMERLRESTPVVTTNTPTPTDTPTITPTPTYTPTNTPTNTPTITPTPTNTATTTPTGTPTNTPTNTPTTTPTPTSTSLPLNGVTAATVGTDHTCALLTMGGVQCWGQNWDGKVGDGTTTTRRFPAAVYGLSSGVTQISAGESHTCALLNTGGVQCWGQNWDGKVGDGTYTDRLVPTDVFGLNSGVTQVSTGRTFTCALLGSGGVQCWGQNMSGQLGDGSTSGKAVPTDVSGLSSGVTQIAAGADHACAIQWGNVKCWGSNFWGKLGAPYGDSRTTPTEVSGLSEGVVQISTGASHTCAVLTTGGIRCWGANNLGGLGDGTTTHSSVPVDVFGLSSGVMQVAAGGGGTCALLTSGEVQCWGEYPGSAVQPYVSVVPIQVSDLSSGVTQISARKSHYCARLSTGGLTCWGENQYGQLADGTTEYVQFTPVDARSG